jgi:hypothetical protein
VRDLSEFAQRAAHHIVAVLKETASGADNKRPERRKVLELASRREIGAILLTELSRWVDPRPTWSRRSTSSTVRASVCWRGQAYQLNPTRYDASLRISDGRGELRLAAIAMNPSLAVVQTLADTYKGTQMAACAEHGSRS